MTSEVRMGVVGGVVAAALLASGCLAMEPEEAPDLGQEQRRVIGGEPTPEGRYEATGALLSEWEGALHFTCTGTLISPQVVLTAGHCIHPLLVGDIPPRFTLALDALTASADEIVAGAEAVMHPEFRLDQSPGLGVGRWNDLGVLILAEPIDGIAYEPLASIDDAEALEPGMPLELVGYGMTAVDDYASGIKHHGVATLMQVGVYELLISDPGEQQNCHGDSGGPAFADIDGERRLVGIVSRSPDPDPVCDHGGVDTRVDPYLDWIDTVVAESCIGQGRRCVAPDNSDIGPAPDEGLSETGGGCRVAGGAGGGAPLVLIALAALWVRRRLGS